MDGDEVDGRDEFGWSRHTLQISPVVTGTGLWRLPAQACRISSSTDFFSPPIRVSLPTTMRVDVA